ncbi:hypothetical protein [Desmospora activa]|uniref:Uncharacterized protein n=1 Tax=Desmospora activa DSM 45169 TaxID=1121389 RepID=A0A2T4Z802_9BACL|nr:hypothetical protein [Desmospora activa]PTM58009.1 hypothetical protein C8J48_0581 [Desmospora activa DSM 45169]
MEIANGEDVTKKRKRRQKWNVIVQLIKKRWPSLVALAIAATGLPASADPMSMILVIAALVYPISGAIRGHLRGVRTILIQTIAFLLFATIALVALYVDREIGLILLAAGYLGHSVWDLVHHRTGMMVLRGYAEFCAVFDFLIAVVLLAPLLQ